MASYKDIQGFNIQNLSSDPVPFAQEKANNPYQGTWASGGNANNSYFGRTGLGVQTSAVAAGGRAPPLSYATSETYDGTSWTETVDMSTARGNATGFGSSTAGIIAAGLNSTLTASITTVESYNGSAWTAVNSINTARNQLAASGNQTAGIIMGGSPVTGFTESWNGTSWTEVADLNTARQSLGGNGGSSGSQTAALAFGGATPTNTGATESWNGSAWSEVNDLNNVRRDLGGVGPQTYGLAYAGEGPGGGTSFTESWDGTSWTELNNLANSLDYLGSAGTSATSALTIGGRLWPPGSQTNITEEWAYTGIPPTAPAAGYTDAIVGQIYYNTTTGSFKAIKNGGAPIGTWSSGGSLNTAQIAPSTFGSQTATISAGGQYPPPYSNQTESYDGSAWTIVGSMPTTRYGGGAAGTSTAGLIFGSELGTAPRGSTISWNGTSWAVEPATLATPRGSITNAAFGTQTAALGAGGNIPPLTGATESYNGTVWTELSDLSNVGYERAGFGTQTEGIVAGLNTPTDTTVVESWNGTSWSTATSLNTGRWAAGASRNGTSTDGIVFGGRIPPNASTAVTESWNGSSWTEVNDLSTARFNLGGTGVTNTAIAVGGNASGTASATTEEFTAADFVINTLTTS